MKIFKKETYHRRTHEEAKKIEEFDESSLVHISKEIVIQRTALIWHFIADVFVNVLLFVLNFFINFNYQWWLWALSGMIFLLAIHCTAYYIFRRGYIYVATESIVAHTAVYIIGNAYLFFINWFSNFLTTRGFPTWAWWSLGGWTAALILHIIIYVMIVPLNHEPKDARWLERKVYSEIRKYQMRRGLINVDLKDVHEKREKEAENERKMEES
jgi:cation transport ATPase